jgi:hypothetical protein
MRNSCEQEVSFFFVNFKFISLLAVMCLCRQLVALAHEASFFVSGFHEGQ